MFNEKDHKVTEDQQATRVPLPSHGSLADFDLGKLLKINIELAETVFGQQKP